MQREPGADAADRAAAAPLRQPVARVEPVIEHYYGWTICDPYRWMEDTQSGEAQAWLRAQAAYTEHVLDTCTRRGALRERVRALTASMDQVTAPQVAGPHAFYLKRAGDDDVARLVVRPLAGGPETVLVDPAGD